LYSDFISFLKISGSSLNINYNKIFDGKAKPTAGAYFKESE
jgi:hypothetical protein